MRTGCAPTAYELWPATADTLSCAAVHGWGAIAEFALDEGALVEALLCAGCGARTCRGEDARLLDDDGAEDREFAAAAGEPWPPATAFTVSTNRTTSRTIDASSTSRRRQ